MLKFPLFFTNFVKGQSSFKQDSVCIWMKPFKRISFFKLIFSLYLKLFLCSSIKEFIRLIRNLARTKHEVIFLKPDI